MTLGSHPTSYSHPGVRLIEPAVQGDYDGLCGLYCIINAIRLTVAPHRELRRDEVRALFTAGVRFLDRKGELPAALHTCVGKQSWSKLAERIVAVAQPMSGHTILLERPRLSIETSVQNTLRRIERIIASGKVPCVFFRGRYRHYSVISGYTPSSLKLFDSFGHHWVLRKSCGTSNCNRPHRLHVRSLIAISVSTLST